MKKIKKSIIVFIFLFLLFPSIIVEAFDDSTGSESPKRPSSDCPNCSWLYTRQLGGVRVGLYKYDGNGKPIKCGNSVDLFNKPGITKIYGYVTSGYTRIDYNHGGATVDFEKSVINGVPMSQTEYLIDYDTAWGTGFISFFKEYMGKDITEIKKSINNLFGYSEFEESEAAQYYISVEPTLGFINQRENKTQVYGTAYEIMSVYSRLDHPIYTSGYLWDFSDSQGGTLLTRMYLAMYVKKNPLKVYNQAVGSYDKYNFVNHNTTENNSLIVAGESSTLSGWTYMKNHFKDSTFPYGITILWLKDLVPSPPGDEDNRSCKNYCSGLDGSALDNCAEQYCDANEPDNSDCIFTCKDTVYDSPGCDREVLNVCYNTDLNTADIKSEGNYCASNGETTTAELTSTICYDDVAGKNYTLESKLVTVNKDKATTSINEYNPVILSYYKIECDEKVIFENLPTRDSDVHVTSSLTATLYAGYTMDYSKVCQIYYKTSDETWDTNYNNSKIKDELERYSENLKTVNDLITKLEKEKKELEKTGTKVTHVDEKERLEEVKKSLESLKKGQPVLEDIVEELENIKQEAEKRLKDVKDKDQADNSSLVNQVEVEISNTEATSSSVQTITLEPVYCVANDATTTENYCDLETQKEYTINKTTNNVSCEDAKGNTITAVVKDGKSTYSEKVYYALPSSYTGINELGTVQVCHTASCAENLESAFEIKNAWVFDPLSGNVSIDAYNGATSNNDLKLTVKGMGSCGQFSYELKCGYDFASSALCKEECIDQYNDPSSEMTEADYEACFQKFCSCDSYCGSNVACRMQYCPQECEGCEDLSKTETPCGTGEKDECVNSCSETYADAEDRLTCRYGCCRTSCNGEAGCIYNCCTDECEAKRANGYLPNEEDYKTCLKMCSCENGSCDDDDDGGRNYIYRTINLKRPFPNGDDVDGREPGANWYGKVKFITNSDDVSTKYYDATDGIKEEYEYRFVLTADNIKEIKANSEINLTYTDFKESKEARNTYEDATKNKADSLKANVYCSYVIHDYFKSLGIEATSNAKNVKNKYVVGSGCYTQ